ncbi:hypothetical protein OXX79_009420 [Metschnikowia pulcherrima]
MASLASPDQGAFSASFEGVKSGRKNKNNDTMTPVRRVSKPRTRSSILKAASQREMSPGSPKKRTKKTKKSKTRNSRSESPVIDLTLDEGVLEDHSGEDSPLKRVTKRSKPAGTDSKQENANDSIDSAGETQTTRNEPEANQASPELETNPTPARTIETTPQIPLLEQPTTLLPRRIERSPDLNSSPIKKPELAAHGPSSAETLRHEILAPSLHPSSSPTKKSKSVAFSDSILQDAPSSPLSRLVSTPKKSILKPSGAAESSPLDPSDSSMWVKTTRNLSHSFSADHAPNNPLFWQPGTIIQLEHKSPDLPQLVDGCVEVLREDEFAKKFEVYATLNLVCRTNDASTVVDLFSGENSAWLASIEKNTGYKPKATPAYVTNVCRYARRDIEAIEEHLYVKNEHPTLSPAKNDPFEARTLTQALKLVSSFLAMPSINGQIPASEIKWFYSHACDMIVHPALSKSLVSPYLSIIKDCHFPSKKRKLLFENHPNAISEKILFAILNMKNYLSSSLINEKFIALRNLIQNFPAILAKHFHHWFPGLLLNLCDLSFVLYSKVVATGITTLLEAARNYLDNNDICLYTRKFIESPLMHDQKSWVTESFASSAGETKELALDHVAESLKSLIDGGYYKFAMDIWVGVTLLMGKLEDGIDTWRHIGTWLSVHKMCFNANSILAKETALSAWKVIVFKICCHDLKNSRFFSNQLDSPAKGVINPMTKQNGKSEDLLRPKIRLLIHPFMCVTSEIRRELVDAFHACFMAILYNLMSPQPKLNARYLQTVWDKVVQPVLLNFYFRKDCSSSHMHSLGLAVMSKLLKPCPPISEKSYSGIRCLSHEPISFAEIGSLNPRWVYLRFDKVLPMVTLALKSQHLPFEAKADGFISFLEAIKYVTKKDVSVSDTTFDLIDNLPMCVEAMLMQSAVSYTSLNRVILALNDTFGAANLVSLTDDTKSVVEPVLLHALRSLPHDQAHSIIGLWYSAIGEKKNLKYLQILDSVNRDLQRTGVTDFIAESLNDKKSAKFSLQELVMVGHIFQALARDFGPVAKKVIQQIVLLKTEDFEKMIIELGIVKWHVSIFNFFVVLMHDAPYSHLRQATVTLIGERAKTGADFHDVAEILLANRFDFEISHLRNEIVRVVKKCEDENSHLSSLWAEYVTGYDSDFAALDELLVCAIGAGLHIDDLAANIWDKVPKSKAAWQAKHEEGSMLEKGDSSTQRDDSYENVNENGTAAAGGSARNNKSILSEDSQDRMQPQGSDSVSDDTFEDTNGSMEEPGFSSRESSGIQKADSFPKPVSAVHNQASSETTDSHSWLHHESECIEISSDDRDDGRAPASEKGALQPPSGNKQASVVDSIVHETTDSLNSETTKSTDLTLNRKRKPAQDSRDRKRVHVDSTISANDSISDSNNHPEDFKQVSDSEESCRERPEDPNRGVEITSSSEEKHKEHSRLQQDKSTSRNRPSIQGQSTANNTSDESDTLALTGPKHTGQNHAGSMALATVQEQPLSESQSPFRIKATALHEVFDQFDDRDLAILNEHERYDLETAMMQFILRMRRASLRDQADSN